MMINEERDDAINKIYDDVIDSLESGNEHNIKEEDKYDKIEVPVDEYEKELEGDEEDANYLKIEELRQKVDNIINSLPALQESITQIALQTRKSVSEVKQELLGELEKANDTNDATILNHIIMKITELNNKISMLQNSIINDKKTTAQIPSNRMLADFWQKPIPDYINDLSEISISVYKVKGRGEVEKVNLPSDNGEISLPITKTELVELIRDISGPGKYSLRARHIPTGRFIGYKAITIEDNENMNKYEKVDTKPEPVYDPRIDQLTNLVTALANEVRELKYNNTNKQDDITKAILLKLLEDREKKEDNTTNVLLAELIKEIKNTKSEQDDTLKLLLTELIKNKDKKDDSKIIELMNAMWKNQLDMMKQNFDNTIKMLQKQNNGNVSMDDMFKNIIQMMTELEKTKLTLQIDEKKYDHEKEMKKLELDYKLREQGKRLGDIEEEMYGTRRLEEQIRQLQERLQTPEQKKTLLDSLTEFIGKLLSMYNTVTNPQIVNNQIPNANINVEDPFSPPQRIVRSDNKQPFRRKENIKVKPRISDKPTTTRNTNSEESERIDGIETIPDDDVIIDFIPLEDTNVERKESTSNIREGIKEDKQDRTTDTWNEHINEQDNSIGTKQTEENRNDTGNKPEEQEDKVEKKQDNASKKKVRRNTKKHKTKDNNNAGTSNKSEVQS